MNASLRGAWVNIEGVDANKVYALAVLHIGLIPWDMDWTSKIS